MVDDSFSDTLAAPLAGATVYSGVYERAGKYDIAVTHAGYRSWRRSGVRVGRDDCHVITFADTARLRREQ